MLTLSLNLKKAKMDSDSVRALADYVRPQTRIPAKPCGVAGIETG